MTLRPHIDYDPFAGPDDPAETEGLTARVGTPAPTDATPPEHAAVVAKLQQCYDPELPVNIYDLGLIYDLRISQHGDVAITMTLTAPGCPVAEVMPRWVARAVAEIDAVGEVAVTITWDPPWRQDMMSEDARLALDL